MFFSEQESKSDLLKYFDRIDLEKPFLNYLEINIVDQCNLNCKGCAHFSNICDNNFVLLDKYKHDLEMIAEKFCLYNFRLLGGEPLLHPQLSELVDTTRKILPNSRIIIVTNGLLSNTLFLESIFITIAKIPLLDIRIRSLITILETSPIREPSI